MLRVYRRCTVSNKKLLYCTITSLRRPRGSSRPPYLPGAIITYAALCARHRGESLLPEPAAHHHRGDRRRGGRRSGARAARLLHRKSLLPLSLMNRTLLTPDLWWE